MARYRGEIEKSDEVTNFRTSRISGSTRMSAFDAVDGSSTGT
jgi:hypothetical protein